MMFVSTEAHSPFTPVCAAGASSPAHLLVIDRLGGPADVLVDTLRLLADRDLSITLVSDPADALRALTFFPFHAVIVGVQPDQPLDLAVLPPVRTLAPEMPVLVVGRRLPAALARRARQYGACEAVALPERAADLRQLSDHLAADWLPVDRAALMPAC